MSELESIYQLIDRKFPEQNIRVLLVGGHAVNAYGFTRATVDVDFIIQEHQEHLVKHLMKESGYQNQSSHGNVLFCNRPDSSFRVDFLKTDSHTMDQLWADKLPVHSTEVSGCFMVSLEHLVAMKLSALRDHFSSRAEKDLPDIAYLAKLHHWSFEKNIKPLMDRFGSKHIESEFCTIWERIS